MSACGVCHTELDEIEGRTPPGLPVVPGHQVVGRVESRGSGASAFLPIGDRVGVAWIFSACGTCDRIQVCSISAAAPLSTRSIRANGLVESGINLAGAKRSKAGG